MVRDSRQPGHFWADNEVLDVYGEKLGAHGLAVYMAMARRADNSTGECILSTRRIAGQVSMSVGGVFNALALIVALGLARKVLDSEHGKPAVYVLADVKALRCSSHEHRCSSGERGVHPVNTQYGSKDFLKTKPNPPTPLFQRGVTARDVRNIAKHVDKFWKGVRDLQGLTRERYRGMSTRELNDLANAHASEVLLIPLAVIEQVRDSVNPTNTTPTPTGDTTNAHTL
jgi:hypothetical protein